MKHSILAFALSLFTAIQCFSQVVTEADTLVTPDAFINLDSIESQMDSIAVVQESTDMDSVYMKRLASLNFQFKLTYNPLVRRYIELYTVKIREKLQVFIGLSDFYFPIMAQVLKENRLPDELKYIAVIESALNPRAVSRARAVGLWQFMKGTGRENKLIVNNMVDQRRSLIESTNAACRYLRFLYNIYGDWQLVLAAYNCGPGRVNRAIHRSKGKTDFWEIYHYLPRETRGYVPEYIGAVYAFNFYREHHITPVPTVLPLQTDTVIVDKHLHFGQVAGVVGIGMDELRSINPQYLKDMIPATEQKQLSLRVPTQVKPKFLAMKDSIYAYRSDFYKKEFLKKEKTPTPHKRVVTAGEGGKLLHQVQEGESLWSIAGIYKVKVTDIKVWNNLSSNKLKPGQKLIISVFSKK
jgi:Soluble lytic murein transglycosylase and related regulatory proteins (some contain LysM/invasin domains)